MTPRTKAGRALLAREAYNSRSFALITEEAILAIEAEAASPKGDGLDPDWLFVLKATHPIGGVFTDMPASNVERVCEVACRRLEGSDAP